jgi:hypothetical protein
VSCLYISCNRKYHTYKFSNELGSSAAYYRPPARAVNDSDPDLLLRKNGGSITIGYGSHRSPPLSYHLRERHSLDLGFFKILLSKANIDFSKISQTSPSVDPPFSGPIAHVSGPQIPSQKLEGTWRTIIIPIIQRRHPASRPSPEPTGTRTNMTAEKIQQLEQENQELKNQVEMICLIIARSEEDLTRLQGRC